MTEPNDIPPSFRLLLIEGDDRREFSLPADRHSFVIGRDASASGSVNICLHHDAAVSRRHARIWAEGGTWWVEDLRSRNGTWLGEMRLRPGTPAQLRSDSVLELGRSRIVLVPAGNHVVDLGDRLLDVSVLPVSAAPLLSVTRRLVTGISVRNLRDEPVPAGKLELALPGIASASLLLPDMNARCSCFLVPPEFVAEPGGFETRVERSWQRLRLRFESREYSDEHLGCWVLAYNECSFHEEHWRALAAFVLPSHPIVSGLALQACQDVSTGARPEEFLQRIYEHLAAVWRIDYRLEPPHAATVSQKIRLPHQLLGDAALFRGAGTCLDLALLIAACLEAMQIHPLVAVVQFGASHHALVGCWKAPQPGLVSLLTNRERLLRDGAWVDPNGCTQEEQLRRPFARARADAEAYMREQEILFVLDVAAARAEGFVPLPLGYDPGLGRSAAEAIGSARAFAVAAHGPLGLVPLLVGLASIEDGVTRTILQRLVDPIEGAIAQLQNGLSSCEHPGVPTDHYEEALAIARLRARTEGLPFVLEPHLLLAVLQVESPSLDAALKTVGTSRNAIRRELQEIGLRPDEAASVRSRFVGQRTPSGTP